MVGVSKLLDTALVEKAELGLKELGHNATIAIKLKAIVAAKSHGITKTADVFGVTKATLFAWIHCLREESAQHLVVQQGRGRKPKLSKEQEATIRQWLTKDSQLTINSLRQLIAEKLDVDIGRATVHRLMQKLGFSYITPRPQHYKQDSSTHGVFKKKSSKSSTK